jgi:hypothetical protein
MLFLVRFTFVLATFVALAGTLCAGEARVFGGLSPDGKLEIVAVESKDTTTPEISFEFILREVASKKLLTKVSSPGYASGLRAAVDNEFAKNSAVLWHPASSAFAFNLRDTKRSRSTVVFAFAAGFWSSVDFKDPFPAVFKNLGIKEVDRCAFLDPLRWDTGDAIVMQASGDCMEPLRGRWFEYEVRYRLSEPGNVEIKQASLKDHNG